MPTRPTPSATAGPCTSRPREAVAARWKRELDYYRGTDLTFADPNQRQERESALERATRILESEPQPWP